METQSRNHCHFPGTYLSAFAFLAVVVLLFIVHSCSPKLTESINTSTTSEYNQRERIEWRDTTIYVPIPIGTGKVITSIGDTARVKTTVAEAAAWVDEKGKLHLELENLRGDISYTTKIPSRDIWTGVTNTRVETLTKIEYREKPLSKWKEFQIGAFWWLLAFLVLLTLWTFRRWIFRI